MSSTPPTPMPAGFTRDALPGRVVYRDGALDDLSAELARLGAQRIMLIVSEHDDHLAERAQRVIGDRLHSVCGDFRQHAFGNLTERTSATACDEDIDALVTVGGGTVIGLGKAVAVSTGVPLICVPTTYSGSEMTQIYALASDHNTATGRDSRALPKVVIYDPQLLISLPSAVVGASAMSALAHCAEALWAPDSDPITDALAVDAARRLTRHLPHAHPQSGVAARAQVMTAACLAGMALGTAGSSIHHALCDLLADMYDTSHALTHAIVLPYSVKFVRPAVPAAIKRLAAAMGTTSEDVSSDIWSLGRAVGIPHGLRAVGITELQVEQAIEAALAKDLASPRPVNRSLLRRLIEGAWRGMSPFIP